METSEPGLYGVGSATLTTGGAAVVTAANDFLARFAMGRDPANIDDIWQTAYWLAYHSNETKRFEVYVMTFPNPGGKWQISTSGGRIQVWSPDGMELFFLGTDKFLGADYKVMQVEIRGSAGKLEASVPKALYDVRFGSLDPLSRFHVSKDGKFLIGTQVEQTASVPMTVVVNWAAGLRSE